QVTWRRDALAGRPVEILDADAEGGRTEAPAALAASAQTAPTELHPAEPETAPTTAEPAVTEIASRNPQPAAAEPGSPIPAPAGEQTACGRADDTPPTSAKPKRQRLASAAAPKG